MPNAQDAPAAAMRPAAGSLPVATLLIAGGGYLDSYAWIAHGHVFTNAISGNVILFGVYAAQGQWTQARAHVLPTLAFFAGVVAAQWLRQHGSTAGWWRASTISLLVEATVLALVAALPQRMDPAVLAALQAHGRRVRHSWRPS